MIVVPLEVISKMQLYFHYILSQMKRKSFRDDDHRGLETRNVLNLNLLFLKFFSRSQSLKMALNWIMEIICYPSSMTRLGDLLDFGQLFKAIGNN